MCKAWRSYLMLMTQIAPTELWTLNRYRPPVSHVGTRGWTDTCAKFTTDCNVASPPIQGLRFEHFLTEEKEVGVLSLELQAGVNFFI